MNIEDVYRLNQATYRSSDNSYEFNYQYQWQTSNRSRSIAIREVRLISAPRILYIDGMKLHDPSTDKTCDISSTVVVPSGTTLTNTDFRSVINDLFTSYIGADSPFNYMGQFHIGYNPGSSMLSYVTTNDRCFRFENPVISDDLKAITHLTVQEIWDDLALLSNGNPLMHSIDVTTGLTQFEIKWANEPIRVIFDSAVNRRIVAIHFTAVWNRDPLLIKASFVDLAYDGYLGFTNSVFTPPKRYDVRSTNNKFYIHLFDGTHGSPIMLPTDMKDQVIIEAIMQTI